MGKVNVEGTVTQLLYKETAKRILSKSQYLQGKIHLKNDQKSKNAIFFQTTQNLKFFWKLNPLNLILGGL